MYDQYFYKVSSLCQSIMSFLFSLITSLFDSLRHGNIYIYIYMYIYIHARVCVWRSTHRDPIVGVVDFHIMKFRKANKPSTEPILIYIYIVSGGDTCIHICIYLNMTMNIIIRTTMYWSSYIIFDMYQLYQNPCLTHWGLLDAYMRQ